MKIIDVHTHGIGGYDVRTTNPDHILKMAEIQGSHGVTHIIPTIYAGPVATMREHMAAVKRAMEIQQHPMSGPPPGPFSSPLTMQHSTFATIAGVHLEGPFLNPLRSGALDGTTFLKPVEKTFRTLIEGFEDIVRIITIAPELEGSPGLIRAMSNMGIKVSLGHSQATYGEAEAGFLAGAKCITHIFNAMRPIHHREPGIVGFGLINPEIYVEVIGDPFHLHVRTIDLVFKVKNPQKIIIVSDTVRESGAATEYQDVRNKDGTLQGGSMTVTEAAKRLTNLGFPEATVTASISTNPWAYLGT